MTTTSQTSDSLYSKESLSNDFIELDNWLVSIKDGTVSSTFVCNSKLNAEIHLAISAEPSEYASPLCDHLFILYRDAQYRPFVLQFLPSFVIAYYDILHRHSESTDATTRDVCSTIDTFFIALYNLSVFDDRHNEKTHEFRIPNLTSPSIYHTPNPDYYAPTPLTQHAISRHEKKCEVIRLHSFSPIDTASSTTRLLGQGFSFHESSSRKEKGSILPPNGRRIHLSSRIALEMLGTLFYFKANSSDTEASACMRLLKQRAEYEMYADVILMTESLSYLHEFDNHQLEHQDTIGIEIELPPTIDMVKQKRTATTTRSMKNRQRTSKTYQQNETTIVEKDLSNDTIENLNFISGSNDATSTVLISSTDQQRNSILDENFTKNEYLNATSRKESLSNEQQIEMKTLDDYQDAASPLIGEIKTYISSSISAAESNTSPSSARHYKPMSLTSTQAYFKTIQQQPRVSAPNVQNVQTILHRNVHDDLIQPHASSMKHGEKKDIITTVRFMGTDRNGTNTKETYL